MLTPLSRQLVEFARTIRLGHTLFALPFALGTALLAEPPCPDARALALVVACLVAARTAAMGVNRVADADLDARNPRTAGRAIPAGRLSPRVALVLALASGGAFLGLAWGFYALRGHAWPGLLAPAFLAVLVGYSWTKRFTALAHGVLGVCLGLAPVGVWVALRGRLDAVPLVVGAAVLCWTAGFDILYSLQDAEVDRREGLHSAAARLGSRGARRVAAALHALTVLLLAPVPLMATPAAPEGRTGVGSLLALGAIAAALVVLHVRARRRTDAEVGAAIFPLNALVSILWLAGVVVDAVAGLEVRGRV